MKVYSFEQFATESGGVAEARKILKAAGIPVIEGHFDKDRLAARLALGSGPSEWTLSPTHGVGAIKACVDTTGAYLTAHYMRRAHSIDVTNSKGETRHMRLRYNNAATRENTTVTFNLNNFLRDDPTTYYAFCALSIPAMWVFSNAQLRKTWDKLRFNTEKVKSTHCDDLTGIWIPAGQWRNQHGGLRFRLSSTEPQYRVSPESMGFK